MVTWQLTIDCLDPGPLVEFWAPVLGYEVQPPPDGHATWNDYYLSVGVPEHELELDGDGSDRIIDPTGRGPRIWFQPVPEPKSLKNRLHLDLDVTDRGRPVVERVPVIEAKVAQLVAAGASVVRRHPEDLGPDTIEGHVAVTMADPEGNEFCVT